MSGINVEEYLTADDLTVFAGDLLSEIADEMENDDDEEDDNDDSDPSQSLLTSQEISSVPTGIFVKPFIHKCVQ
ncbi:hypothetical protein AVEN_120112-1 [Araneus ventricosus]|uniref:Uncharacterized protein n=1 Tax=Araneus ventricosus TaxID=182803 RepID=A0A4Y2DVG1_ARAVE|nr:hypothetical protein AVEN_120112-1 [Araneus ventricosus]